MPKKLKTGACPTCWKSKELCPCPIEPSTNRVQVGILQHPAESNEDLGTARLLSLSLSNVVHRIGLSWPNLASALKQKADPKRWALLRMTAPSRSKGFGDNPLRLSSLRGRPGPALGQITGLILIDGSWKQAKTLLWRNRWLTRLPQIELNPELPSGYGGLRRAPRKTALSTIEAAAQALELLGETPDVPRALRERFSALLEKVRAGGGLQG